MAKYLTNRQNGQILNKWYSHLVTLVLARFAIKARINYFLLHVPNRRFSSEYLSFPLFDIPSLGIEPEGEVQLKHPLANLK